MARDYLTELMRVVPRANLVGYWPLDDPSGRSYAREVAARVERPGSPTAVTFGAMGVGDGRTAATFDGSTSYIDVYSESLVDLFNGVAGTIVVFCKVSGVGVWTDGVRRRLVNFNADVNNFAWLYKAHVPNNSLVFEYNAGGTLEQVILGSLSETGWMALALTWDGTADQVKAYYAGSQTGSTQTGLGTWAGDLVSTHTVIGAENNTPTNLWSGDMAHVALWRKALTAAQVAAIHNASDPGATIQATEREDLIGYWPLDDAVGASSARDLSPMRGMEAQVISVSGAGPGMGDGRTALEYDGANDLVYLYTQRLVDAFPGPKGSLSMWVNPLDTWNHGGASGARPWASLGSGGAGERVTIDAQPSGFTTFQYRANNVTLQVTTTWTDSGYRHLVLAWGDSANGDEFKVYRDGAQVGSTQTGAGAWGATDLDDTYCCIGANGNTEPPNLPFPGHVAHTMLFDDILTPAQIRKIYELGVRAR